MIIDHTTDLQTLDSWCRATQYNPYLHKVALTARWKTAVIDDRDLFPAPGADQERFNEIQERLRRNNLGQQWKPAGEMVEALLRPIDGSNCYGANFVQDLTFDFRLLRYWKDEMQCWYEKIEGDWVEEEDSDEESGMSYYTVHDLLPTSESLKYTLTKLDGHFHDLSRLTCHGNVPCHLLDFLASQDVAKLHSLEMRSLKGYLQLEESPEDEPSDEMCPLGRWPLRLKLLSTFRQLQTLTIYRLSTTEIAGLLSALPSLSKLRCLKLACEGEEHRRPHSGCALRLLLEKVFDGYRTKEVDGDLVSKRTKLLPPNLKSLSLIDTYSLKT